MVILKWNHYFAHSYVAQIHQIPIVNTQQVYLLLLALQISSRLITNKCNYFIFLILNIISNS